MKQFLKNINLGRLFFVLFVTVPVLSGIIYAVLYSFGLIGLLNKEFTSEAWETVILGKSFWTSFFFSFYVAVVSVGVSLIISLVTAISFRKNLSNGVLATAIYLPLCFPGTVMAFFSFQMLSKSGFLSRLGYNFGWIENLRMFPSWINDGYGIGIIFTSILLITPFFIILFSNLYQSEKVDNFRQLATTFGASRTQVLFKVTFPIMLKRASVTIYLFVIFVMGSYEVPLLLGRQDPQMISVAIIQKIQRYNLSDIPQGYAMSVLYVLLIIVILFFLYFKNSTFFKVQSEK